MNDKSTLAVALELIGGLVFQVYGVGHIYTGQVGKGVALMISYWVLQFINALLCMVLIGFVTMPLTWIAYSIYCPLSAADAAKRM